MIGGAAVVALATGRLAVGDNDVELAVHGLPPDRFGYFLMAADTSWIPVASGILCLAGPQFRLDSNILNSGPAGVVTLTVDLTNLPQGQTFAPGQTWLFQLWRRDGPSSNFSSNLAFTWQ
ncbi:MAG: hypothetical protein GY711_17325 [bacterium]|nr:hypothetical protein [bacterium]